MANPRKMPTRPSIRTHWLNVFKENGLIPNRFSLSVYLDEKEQLCWKCATHGEFCLGDIERAHITSRFNGGLDSADNLHLLCSNCHKESEFLEGEAYWKWFMEN